MDVIKSVTNYIKNTDLYLVAIALLCSAYGMVLIYSATLNPASWQDGSTRNLFIQGAAIILGLGAFVIMKLIESVLPVFLPVVFSAYFDLFDGLIQAYVFVFLTGLFIKEAIE